MIVACSMHDRWLSNAYLVGDEPGGTALFVDSGAPLQPLLDVLERHRLTPTHVLRTHGHADHVEHEDELCERFGLEVATDDLVSGGLHVRALPLPGHSDDGVAFVVNDELCFTGDVLFRDAVGGGPAAVVRRSVMDGLMGLPHALEVLPGHAEATTVGQEWETNPFVRYWRGAAPAVSEPVRVGGEEAVLLVWSPDYDGKGKALVRLADGEEAIVGGSRVERAGGRG